MTAKAGQPNQFVELGRTLDVLGYGEYSAI